MKKAVDTTLKIIYLLPLFLLAVNITLFSTGEIISNSFEQDCRESESKYTFHDFCVFYSCGRIAQSSDRKLIYDAATQQKYLADIRGASPLKENTLVMELAPFFPCLMIPLTWLPIGIAYCIYFVGSMAAFFAAVFLLKPSMHAPVKLWSMLLMAFCLLGTVPACITAMLSQISFYIFLLISAYIFCLQTKREKLAAIPLALLGIKPHYAIFMALPALAHKKWPLLLIATAVEAILLAISALILGWPAVAGYPAAVMAGDNSGSWTDTAVLMISLRGLLCALGTWSWIFPLTFILMMLAALALLILWNKTKIDDSQVTILWSLTIVLLLFCSAHAHIYDAVLLFIPMILLPSKGESAAKQPNKYARFTWLILLCSPYLQWLGMIVLPKNIHRSLPTSLLLLTLTISLTLAWLRRQNSE